MPFYGIYMALLTVGFLWRRIGCISTSWTWTGEHYEKSCDHTQAAFDLEAVSTVIDCLHVNATIVRDSVEDAVHLKRKGFLKAKYKNCFQNSTVNVYKDKHAIQQLQTVATFHFSVMAFKLTLSYCLSPVEVFPTDRDITAESLEAYLEEPMEIGFRGYRAPWSNRTQTLMFLAQIALFFVELVLYVCFQRPNLIDIWWSPPRHQLIWLVLTFRLQLLWPTLCLLSRGMLMAAKFKQAYGSFVNVTHPTLIVVVLAFPFAKLCFFNLALAWASVPSISLVLAYQYRDRCLLAGAYVSAGVALVVPTLFYASSPSAVALTIIGNGLFMIALITHRISLYSKTLACMSMLTIVMFIAMAIHGESASLQMVPSGAFLVMIGVASSCSDRFRRAFVGEGITAPSYLGLLCFVLVYGWPVAISRASALSFAPYSLCSFEEYIIGVDMDNLNLHAILDNDFFLIWVLVAMILVALSSFAAFRSLIPFVDVAFLLRLRRFHFRRQRSVYLFEMVGIAYGVSGTETSAGANSQRVSVDSTISHMPQSPRSQITKSIVRPLCSRSTTDNFVDTRPPPNWGVDTVRRMLTC